MRRLVVLALVAALGAPAQASVSSSTSSSGPYACTGVGPYTVGFRFSDPSHLVVSRAEGGIAAVLALGTDYTVTSTSTGGSFTLTSTSKCSSGQTLTVARATPRTQPTVLSAQGVNPKALEAALDRGVFQAQEIDLRVAGAEATHASDKATQATRDQGQDLTLIATIAALNPTSATANGASSVQALGTTNPRTLAVHLADTYAIDGFTGVDPTGVADSGAAINTALAALPAGARVYFPRQYLTSIAIAPASNQTLFGPGTIKKKASSDTTRLLYISGKSNVVIDGLTFDGNLSAQPAQSGGTAEMAKITGSTGVEVRSSTFTNWQANLMMVADSVNVSLHDNHFVGGEGQAGMSGAGLFVGGSVGTQKNIVVTGNTFDVVRTPYWSSVIAWETGAFSPRLDGFVFTGNLVRQGFALGHLNAASVTVQGGAYRFTVSGNTILGGSIGLSLSNVQDGTASGNYIELGDATGTAFGNGKHLGIEVTVCARVSVTGNTVKGRGYIHNAISVTGVGGVDNSLVGNNLSGVTSSTYGRPISVSDQTGLLIAANLVDAAGGYDYGIAILAGSTEVTVTSNLVRNPTGYAIFAASANLSNLTITSNSCFGSTTPTAAIRVENYSSATIVGNNANCNSSYGVLFVASNVGSPVNNLMIRNNMMTSSAGYDVWLTNSTSYFGSNIVIESIAPAIPAAGYHPVGFSIVTPIALVGTQTIGAATPEYVRTGYVVTTAGVVGTFKQVRVLTGN